MCPVRYSVNFIQIVNLHDPTNCYGRRYTLRSVLFVSAVGGRIKRFGRVRRLLNRQDIPNWLRMARIIRTDREPIHDPS